jgi:hypothetical protein
LLFELKKNFLCSNLVGVEILRIIDITENNTHWTVRIETPEESRSRWEDWFAISKWLEETNAGFVIKPGIIVFIDPSQLTAFQLRWC